MAIKHASKSTLKTSFETAAMKRAKQRSGDTSKKDRENRTKVGAEAHRDHETIA